MKALRRCFSSRSSRFVPQALAVATLVSLPAALAHAAPDLTHDKLLYTVATAHLDTQWNWTIQNTINSYIPATLTNNFTLFGKYPDYVFSFEGAFRYRLAKEYYPDWYATMSNYIAQGRWRVAGSAVDAGDVNLPSPESLIRQVLYGNGYWQKEFGKTSLDIFLPDCFGFGYALPAIAAHCGLKGFSSQKLTWGSSIPIPFQNVGRWVGPDGASVVAVLQPGAYNSSISANLAYDTGYLNRITNMAAATGLSLDYRYFGTGDIGGSPSDSSVNWLEQSVTTTNGLLNVLSAGSDQLYRDLTPDNVSHLPVYQGELLMKTHGTGCYTAHPEMKQYNRQNELRADAAERLAVVADWLQGGGTYPQAKLQAAWERFLWHQFHDDLTGTSIPQAYTFSWNDELLSLNEFGSEATHGAGILAEALDTTAQGVPLLVYNALSIPREDIVEAAVTFPAGAPAAVRVYDANGAEVPSQMGAPRGTQVPVTFLANVPADGAAVFDVRPAATPCTLATGLSVSASQLENARYRVQLNANGDVASVFDKINGRELLSAPVRWAFLADASASWPAWEIQYNDLLAAPVSYLGGPADVQVLESGPARASLAVTRYNAGSAFTERLRLGAGAAADRLEWDVSATWGTRQTLLKVVFPLSATNATATYDLGLGTIQRGNDTANQYESPAQQWADLSSSNKAFGVTLLSESRYGWDKPNDNTLRLTIFHTPAVGSSYVYQATNGFGTHHFAFGLAGHVGDWRNGAAPWLAARLNQPLQAFQTTSHAGLFGKSLGFLACNNSNVMVKAIKKAEKSTELIVRLQELTGQPQTAQLTFASALLTARQVNGFEDPLANLSSSDGTLTVSLGAYQPMTLAVTLSSPSSFIPRPVSTPVSLPFNLDAVSTDARRTDGNFDAGYTYPAELFPATLVRDGITFQLGPTNDGAFNALGCQGQTIALPAGYDRLYLLAAAASNDLTATFTLAGQGTNLTVRYFSGFIGQWNPPFLKKDEVAWVDTHRHTGSGANDAYRFCYLFKYRLDIPAGATTLTLPNSPNLRLFALSAARNTTADTAPAGGNLAANQSPWTNAGADQTLNAPATTSPAAVVLDGTGSVDPDGSIVAYAWSLNGTLLATGATPVVSLPIGTNRVILTVTDDQGDTSQDPVTITVRPPLTVTLTAAPAAAAAAPLTVQFSAQATGGNPTPMDTTDDQLGTITAQGQNSNSGEVAASAFDNSTSTKWLDFATNNPTTRASWIQYQYASSLRYVVTNYTLTSANDFPDRDPAAWRLLGSNDGGVSWTTLDVRTNQVFGARFQKLSFSAANSTAFNLYRLQIDSVANPATANSVQLSELELIGPPAYFYAWSFGDGTTSALQNPQHTYTNNGNYRVVLAVTYGLYSGTNTALITIGAPLVANAGGQPLLGAAPLAVQFNAKGSGGNSARAPYDTTEDQRGTLSAQWDNPPNESAAKAFDNSTSTKWLDFANGSPATRASWIQYRYPAGMQTVVSQYALTSANDHAERDPANWQLLASNDGSLTWTTLDVQTNQTFASRYQTQSYNLSNTNSYSLYRLQIDSVANPATANSVQLSELQLIGTPACTYTWDFGDGTTATVQNPRHLFQAAGNYNVTLVVSDGAAAVTNSMLVQVLPLTLLVSAQSSGQLTFRWPAWATNCSLYATTNLTPPLAWSLVTNQPTLGNGLLTLTLPTTFTNRFFQLRSP